MPSTLDEWNKEFDNYKQYPEYKISNPNMDVEGFKKIFYLEFYHRLLGSSLGL